MVRQGFQPFPGEVGKAQRQQNHEQKNPSPKLRFLAFKFVGRAGRLSAAGGLSHGGSHLVSRSLNDERQNRNTTSIVIIPTGANNRGWRIGSPKPVLGGHASIQRELYKRVSYI